MLKVELMNAMLAMAPAGNSGGAAAGSQQPAWVSLLPMVIIFVVFYFLLIRPQVKKQKELEKMIKGVKTGDKVVAAGGIIGVITNVKDDAVVLKIADNVKIEVQRSSIGTVLKSDDSAPAETK